MKFSLYIWYKLEQNYFYFRNWKHKLGRRVQTLLSHRSRAETPDPRSSGWVSVRSQLQQRNDHLRIRFCGTSFELHAK